MMNAAVAPAIWLAAIATTDGGATWQPQPTDTLNPLRATALPSGGSLALITV
jgi:hypothetical protein